MVILIHGAGSVIIWGPKLSGGGPFHWWWGTIEVRSSPCGSSPPKVGLWLPPPLRCASLRRCMSFLILRTRKRMETNQALDPWPFVFEVAALSPAVENDWLRGPPSPCRQCISPRFFPHGGGPKKRAPP